MKMHGEIICQPLTGHATGQGLGVQINEMHLPMRIQEGPEIHVITIARAKNTQTRQPRCRAALQKFRDLSPMIGE